MSDARVGHTGLNVLEKNLFKPPIFVVLYAELVQVKQYTFDSVGAII